MIKVLLMGGLGNQMFQYAIGRSLAITNRDRLVLDTSWFDGAGNLEKYNPLYTFRLPVFDIRNFKIDNISFLYLFSYVIAGYKVVCETKEMSGRFCPEIYSLRSINKDIYLEGYWQNENYFKGIQNIIRKEFVPKKEISEKIDNQKSVSLHIRRGDYVKDENTKKIFAVLGLDYYKNAIDLIAKKIGNPEIFVFSDDIPWVKENLKIDLPVRFVENKEDYEDMWLMSRCQHHIIANSSFSWWGAWLGNNPDKIVIAPKQWFAKEEMEKRKGFDIVPENWIKI